MSDYRSRVQSTAHQYAYTTVPRLTALASSPNKVETTAAIHPP